MATTYRFTGTNIDFYVYTDSAINGEQFIISDIQGLDGTDIMNGFDVGVIPYNEGELIALAREHTATLRAFDERRLDRTLIDHISSNPGGRFNGFSSNLEFGSLVIGTTTPHFPISIKCDVLFTIEDLNTMRSRRIIWGSDTAETPELFLSATYDPLTGLNLTASIAFNANATAILTTTIPYPNERYLSIELSIRQIATNFVVVDLIVNNEVLVARNIQMATTIAQNNIDLLFGARLANTVASEFMAGFMRNILITTSQGTVVDVSDPSTGTNAGTAGDGTASNIDQLTIIGKYHE